MAKPRGSKRQRLADAVKRYEAFTGMTADSYAPVQVEFPDVAIEIGRVEAIAYSTIREGKVQRYLHKFRKSAQPVFAAGHDGKQLLLINIDGRQFEFTERGIVDT